MCRIGLAFKLPLKLSGLLEFSATANLGQAERLLQEPGAPLRVTMRQQVGDIMRWV